MNKITVKLMWISRKSIPKVLKKIKRILRYQRCALVYFKKTISKVLICNILPDATQTDHQLKRLPCGSYCSKTCP